MAFVLQWVIGGSNMGWRAGGLTGRVRRGTTAPTWVAGHLRAEPGEPQPRAVARPQLGTEAPRALRVAAAFTELASAI
jgi:hypothetical protein